MLLAIIPSFAIEPSASAAGGNPLLPALRFGSTSRTKNLSISSRKPFWQRKRRYLQGAKVRSVSENLGSLPDPLASSSNSRYHPSEEIEELVSGENARFSDAETARTLVVQVITGLDNIELLEELEMSGSSDFDFGMEEITSEDSDFDDDSDGDVFEILEDEERMT